MVTNALKTSVDPLSTILQDTPEDVALNKKIQESIESKAGLEVAKEKEQAIQKSMEAKGQEDVQKEFARKVEEDPLRAEKLGLIEKQKDTTFVPTKETINDLAAVFTLTNLLGFMIGGKSKGNAQAALSAQNGMLEGHQKGLQDVYKREKDIFDENQKALEKTINSLDKQLTENIQLYQTDRDAGLAAIRTTLAEHNARFLQDSLEKYGPAYMYDQLMNTKKVNDQLKEKKAKLYEHEEKIENERIRQQQRDIELAETRRYHDIEAAKQGRGVTQQQAMGQRAVNALGGVASAVESLKELPAGTTTGLLPNLQTKDGMTNYIRNSIGRKITDADAEIMNTLFTGIGRNLATIEGSGVATGLGELSKQMQSGVYINAGVDDPYKVAIKLADIRRIATENIQPAIDSGLMPEAQRETAQKLVQRIQEAIPFTTKDVVLAHNKGRKTIGEVTEQAARPAKTFNTEAEAEAAFNAGTLKSGEKVTIGGKTGTWE